ncbi:MAG: hypothetical protein FJY65_05900 [Calditrichaeota bacterium]|nr:hypothetical protein [Calditrichota bacterium]
MRRIIPCQVFLEKYSNLCKILSKNGYLWFMKENKRWIEGARREARNDECACRRDQYLDLSRKMLSLKMPALQASCFTEQSLNPSA